MRALPILLCGLLLSSCGTVDGVPDLVPQPAPQQISTPTGVATATSVNLSIGACKQTQVQHPARVGMNARVALKLTDHALSVANGHIINGNACIDDAMAQYAAGLQKPQ